MKSALLARLSIRARRDARVLPLLEHRPGCLCSSGNTPAGVAEEQATSTVLERGIVRTGTDETGRIQFLAEDMYDR
jgi:hypothetical protein